MTHLALSANGELDLDPSSAPRRALDVNPPAERFDSVPQSDQPGASAGVSSARAM